MEHLNPTPDLINSAPCETEAPLLFFSHHPAPVFTASLQTYHFDCLLVRLKPVMRSKWAGTHRVSLSLTFMLPWEYPEKNRKTAANFTSGGTSPALYLTWTQNDRIMYDGQEWTSRVREFLKGRKQGQDTEVFGPGFQQESISGGHASEEEVHTWFDFLFEQFVQSNPCCLFDSTRVVNGQIWVFLWVQSPIHQ